MPLPRKAQRGFSLGFSGHSVEKWNEIHQLWSLSSILKFCLDDATIHIFPEMLTIFCRNGTWSSTQPMYPSDVFMLLWKFSRLLQILPLRNVLGLPGTLLHHVITKLAARAKCYKNTSFVFTELVFCFSRSSFLPLRSPERAVYSTCACEWPRSKTNTITLPFTPKSFSDIAIEVAGSQGHPRKACHGFFPAMSYWFTRWPPCFQHRYCYHPSLSF